MTGRKPPWLRQKIHCGATVQSVQGLIRKGRLHTVCEEALCPNRGVCYSNNTATFLILGVRCTRNCRFCALPYGQPVPPDFQEATQVGMAAKQMGLDYVVVTSVTRDDLPDGGASWFVRTIREIRKYTTSAMIEVLVPDFQADAKALKDIVAERPQVVSHNLETVPSQYSGVRPMADYDRSLGLLQHVRNLDKTIATKSGMMLGLGETTKELEKSLKDLRSAGCQLLTLGQYLQPTKKHLPVIRFVPPKEFDAWRDRALEMGFSGVAAGPFVRSSYEARALYELFAYTSLADSKASFR